MGHHHPEFVGATPGPKKHQVNPVVNQPKLLNLKKYRSNSDRFGNGVEAPIPEVKEALERIARALSARFELEDQLLYAEPH